MHEHETEPFHLLSRRVGRGRRGVQRQRTGIRYASTTAVVEPPPTTTVGDGYVLYVWYITKRERSLFVIYHTYIGVQSSGVPKGCNDYLLP